MALKDKEQGRFHIELDNHGYMIDKRSYRVSPAPLFGTKFATGRSAYTDLDVWQTGAMTDWSHGMGQKFMQDPSAYSFSCGIDVSSPGELKLEKRIMPAVAVPLHGSNVSCDLVSLDALYVGTEEGKIFKTTDGLTYEEETLSGTNHKIYSMYEHAGSMFACRGIYTQLMSPSINSFNDTFETGTLSNWVEKSYGGTWAAATDQKYAGTYSAKGSGVATELRYVLSAPSYYGWVEGYFRFNETDKDHYPVMTYNASGKRIYMVVAASDGHFKHREGVTYTNFVVDTTYTTGTWYKIKVYWASQYSGGRYAVYINDVHVSTGYIYNTDVGHGIKKLAMMNSSASTISATMWSDNISYKAYWSQTTTTNLYYAVTQGATAYGSFNSCTNEFSDDFELNDNLATWDDTGSWITGGTYKYSGNYGAAAGPSPTICSKNFPFPTMKGYMEGYFKFPTVTGYHYPFYPLAGDGNSLYLVVAGFHDTEVAEEHVDRWTSWGYWNGEVYKQYPERKDKVIAANTWYHVRLSWDVSENRFDVWIDGDRMTGKEGCRDVDALATGIKSIRMLNTNSGGSQMMYADEIIFDGDTTPAQIMSSPNGEDWTLAFDLPSKDHNIQGMVALPTRTLIGTERGLWSFLGGASALPIMEYPELSDSSNFKHMHAWSSLGMFGIKNHGMFYSDGSQVYPTIFSILNTEFKYTECGGFTSVGNNIYSLVKVTEHDQDHWYVARSNLDYVGQPRYWWFVDQIDDWGTPTWITSFLGKFIIFFEDSVSGSEIAYQDTSDYVGWGHLITSRIDEGLLKLQKLYKNLSIFSDSTYGGLDDEYGEAIYKGSIHLYYNVNPLYKGEQLNYQSYWPGLFSFGEPGTDTLSTLDRADVKLENPTIGRELQLAVYLEPGEESHGYVDDVWTVVPSTPVVTDMCWEYSLEFPEDEYLKKTWSFQIIGEDRLEKRDEDISDPDMVEGRLRQDIVDNLWTTAKKKEILNFVGADNLQENALQIQYTGTATSCVLDVDKTNHKLYISANDGSISYDGLTLSELVGEINTYGAPDILTATILAFADPSDSAEDLMPLEGLEIKTSKILKTGTDVHAVIINQGTPAQYKMNLSPNSDRIQMSLREV